MKKPSPAKVFTDDIEFDASQFAQWFPHLAESPFTLIRVADEHAKSWASHLSMPIRRCYVTDRTVLERALQTGASHADIIAARLPNPGSTMAGDFGEILVYFYQAARAHPSILIGPKKWRLKQDRTKPAPLSDVVQFFLPDWPLASENDELICSEVKTKSTKGASSPITSAIEDCKKDRTSRLARTLMWLKDRALLEPLGDDVEMAHLDRFIHTTEYPIANKKFRAVAVICASLAKDELIHAPAFASESFDLIIITVPNLHGIYSTAFEAAMTSLPPAKAVPGKRK
ncbi:MAG: hypothetical protein JWP59_2934 [Massilia sp.]|jgi:hypothetical protein|nr:hypothetical protein [Massilia sp.]